MGFLFGFFAFEFLLGVLEIVTVFFICLVKYGKYKRPFAGYMKFMGNGLMMLPKRLREKRESERGEKVTAKAVIVKVERVFIGIVFYWYIMYRVFEIYKSVRMELKEGC